MKQIEKHNIIKKITSKKSTLGMRLIVYYAVVFVVLALILSNRWFLRPPNSSPQQTAAFAQQNLSFLKEIRSRIEKKIQIKENDPSFNQIWNQTNFPKQFYGIALAVYQPGQKRIVIIRHNKPPHELVRTVINRMMAHPRIKSFAVSDPARCRFQVDFILEKPKPYDFKTFSEFSLKENRFEIGVDGLQLSAPGNRSADFLPGDGFVRSLLGQSSLKDYLLKLIGEKTDFNDLSFKRFRTQSYISYQDQWLPLYRGYPVLESLSKTDLEKAIDRSVSWILKTQKSDGRFLYYYDAANNSYLDHEHPKRNPKTNPYYNDLRHAGGALFLLFHYRHYHDGKVLPHIRSALDFLMTLMVPYQPVNGKPAAYQFYNEKAKLGGAGLTLYLLSEYQHLTGDKTYRDTAELLKNHIINEIRPSGEFYYYHIYPGRTKEDPLLFSFYYPGEGLIGLAGYYKYLALDSEKPELKEKIQKALHFLLYERPKLYKQHFTSLPSDSWLMMAINELWDMPELRDEAYKAFVFADADKMTELMYKENDALYPDYIGSFYYRYGDHAYPDGARCEGLLGAYELARKTHSKDQITRYARALKMAAWAVMHLVNTPESTYSVPNPDLAIGGIRFKLTRQWFRIDTIQHVAAFFLKFLPHLEQGEVYRPIRS